MTESKEKIKADRILHHAAAVVGGFMGAYALLNHDNIFGSSQTSNMIRLVSGPIAGCVLSLWLMMLGAFLIYAFSLALTVLLPKFTKVKLRFASCVLTALCAVILAFVPEGAEHEIALYPIFFSMAFQWNAFISAEGYVSSTIFSTNNLKQAVTSLTEYICSKKTENLHKAKFYFLTLLFYHLGVLLCAAGYVLFAAKGIWLVFLPLAILSALVIKYDGIYKETE